MYRLLPLLLAASCAKPPVDVMPVPAPDLVVIGTAYLDPPEAPQRVGIVVRDGRIAEVVGADEAFTLTDGPVLTADRVTPGFVDAHAHPLGLGRRLSTVDLTGLPTYAATLDAVRAAAEGDGWLTGRGWDQNDWDDAPEGGWPLAADLDAIVSDRPVMLVRIDGHAAWLNAAALAESGIDATTADPAGGRILRDGDGAPAGVLVDNALDLVDAPEPTDAQIEAWLRTAMAAVVEVGLTGVHAMGMTDATLAVYERLDAAGELPVRVWAYVSPKSGAAQRLAAEGPWSGTHLHVMGVKAFADGALGSRGALLTADYADEPGHAGLEVTSADELEALAIAQLGAGSQLVVHAIGDLGVRRALDAFEAARAAHPDRAAVPLRVEHAQVVHPDDVPRFAELAVVASMQPTHATSDMPWAEDRLGAERVRWAYAWQTLLDAGATLAFGSDFPIEEVDPGLGLWSATRRTDLSGQPEGGWTPEERVSDDVAVAGFTSGAAAAVGAADTYGAIARGRPADLTLWAIDDDGRWRATATVVGGALIAGSASAPDQP